MKNRKLLYVLIPAVILIWGAFVYKIYERIHAKKPVMAIQTYSGEEMKFEELDTFSIGGNYRDPFLNLPVHALTANVKQKDLIRTKPVGMLEKKWPSVFYFGMIKNLHSSKHLVMIQINGASATMKPGDVIEGVELKKVFRDSIEIGFEKGKKIIHKSS